MTLTITDNHTFTLHSERYTLVIHIPSKAQLDPAWLWTQLAVVVLLVGTGLSIIGAARGIALGCGIIWMVVTTQRIKENRHTLGLIWKNSRDTAWMLEVAAFAVFVIWLIGLVWGPARHLSYFRENLLAGKIGYFLVAALQEIVIQAYVFVRLEKLLGSQNISCKWPVLVCRFCRMPDRLLMLMERLLGYESRASRWTAVVFTLCHLPNPALMVVAWVGGRISCAIFARYRNVWTLALAHGMIGAAIAAFWPHWMVVAGIGFIKHCLGR